jgi:hypothetical protein
MALLPVKSSPATNPSGGRDTTRFQLNFKLKRYKSTLATDQLVMTHCFPHAFLSAS